MRYLFSAMAILFAFTSYAQKVDKIEYIYLDDSIGRAEMLAFELLGVQLMEVAITGEQLDKFTMMENNIYRRRMRKKAGTWYVSLPGC